MARAANHAVLAMLAVATTLLLVASLAALGCAPKTEQKQTTGVDVQSEVDSLFENYVDALNRSDSTAVLSAFAPDSQATLAGRGRFFRGKGSIARAASETLFNPGQNTYDIDSLDVFPIEREHALALVVYVVDPSDQDIPAFHLTGTYLLRRSGRDWKIVHAHLSSAREL